MSPSFKVTPSTGRSALTVMPWEPATHSPPMPARETGISPRRSTSAATRASASSNPAPNRI